MRHWEGFRYQWQWVPHFSFAANEASNDIWISSHWRTWCHWFLKPSQRCVIATRIQKNILIWFWSPLSPHLFPCSNFSPDTCHLVFSQNQNRSVQEVAGPVCRQRIFMYVQPLRRLAGIEFIICYYPFITNYYPDNIYEFPDISVKCKKMWQWLSGNIRLLLFIFWIIFLIIQIHLLLSGNVRLTRKSFPPHRIVLD